MSRDGAKSQRRKPTFHERLAALTEHQARRMLGDDGESLLRSGAQKWDIDLENDVYLGGDLFRVRLPDYDLLSGKAVVVITQMEGKQKGLHLRCDRCERPCLHAGAALSLLLEEKLSFGLSAPPDESVPFELLTEQELTERALAERRQRADEEKMTLRSWDPRSPWTDYIVTSRQSGRSYRVALHGEGRGEVYCSCPDFQTNRLGTCKHILQTLDKVRKRFPKSALKQPYVETRITAWLDYGEPAGIRFRVPDDTGKTQTQSLAPYNGPTPADAQTAVRLIGELTDSGEEVFVYPDAEEWLDRELIRAQLRNEMQHIRRNPAEHPLRHELLKVPLLPYQLDGIAFAVGAGRAILADDMGLGKTIQGIGTAELLSRLTGIERVLVICPASLKSQWRDEIHRFSDRSARLVIGSADERAAQYAAPEFFTICNYEQVLRDVSLIERGTWDLIILDEGQRIKNWESKTSAVVRSLRSRFVLVLSGTPLENRLDDLYTVIRFVDDRLLGPAYQFFHRHRIVSDTGRVSGYRHLDELRERLSTVLLRRTRAEVMSQLPDRTTSVVRIRPTAEQLELHNSHMQVISKIVRKRYLTEMDLIRLQKAMMLCRMAADGTMLVDKQHPGYSSKLDRLTELLSELIADPARKIVLFSEWRMMLDRIEQILERLGADYVRLDGQVPQKKRPALVNRFQENPDCRVILMTNAGSTGLNLQSADTVINVDLPWNPAVLEQRIARAHRMGQKNPVHVYLLVTEETLEERLLDTLAMKQDLANAALDAGSDVAEVHVKSGMEELRRRLERMVGEAPPAPVDESMRRNAEAETERIAARREKVASAGGQLIGAAFELVGELIAGNDRPAPDPRTVDRLREGLAETIERDSEGRPQLRVTLPDDAALGRFAETLARLLVTGSTEQQNP